MLDFSFEWTRDGCGVDTVDFECSAWWITGFSSLATKLKFWHMFYNLKFFKLSR